MRYMEEEYSESNLTVNNLIGRQFVRATFKLPQDVINLLAAIAAQLGIKKKSLFDQLLKNTAELEEIARKSPDCDFNETGKCQKNLRRQQKLSGIDQPDIAIVWYLT